MTVKGKESKNEIWKIRLNSKCDGKGLKNFTTDIYKISNTWVLGLPYNIKMKGHEFVRSVQHSLKPDNKREKTKQEEAFFKKQIEKDPKNSNKSVFCSVCPPSEMTRLNLIPQTRWTRTSSGPVVLALGRRKHWRAPTTLGSYLDLNGEGRRTTAALETEHLLQSGTGLSFSN